LIPQEPSQKKEKDNFYGKGAGQKNEGNKKTVAKNVPPRVCGQTDQKRRGTQDKKF